MTSEEISKLATWKLLGKTDCIGCRHLYLVRNFANSGFVYGVRCDCSRNPGLIHNKVLVSSPNNFPNAQELQGMRCEKYVPTGPEYE